MTEAIGNLARTRNLVGGERPRHWRGENVELARIGDLCECCSRYAEVFGKHLGRRVLEPVAEQERVILVEIAVVEHQQELGAVRTETLDRMGNAGGEAPQVAHADVVDEVSP